MVSISHVLFSVSFFIYHSILLQKPFSVKDQENVILSLRIYLEEWVSKPHSS